MSNEDTVLEPGGALAQCPDVETSSTRYCERFKGRTGLWFLEQQEHHLLALLKDCKGTAILDIGGGHGQYTRQLLRLGYDVTIVGSSPEADAMVRDLVTTGQCRYMVSDLLHVDLAEKSYDIVLSFRLMTHIGDWRGLLREAARVARHAVIIDFPSLRSFNFAYPGLFWLKCLCEKHTTRTYRVLREKEIRRALGDLGMAVTGRRALHFIPMFVHRTLRMPRLSKALETLCSRLGLTRAFGSPVILRAEPDEDHRL